MIQRRQEVISLYDGLGHPEPAKRHAALKSLKDIATLIGPIRVRSELLPFLTEFCQDETYILEELVSQLADFQSELGGPQHSGVLIPLLITLCRADEKAVAQKCVQLMTAILKEHSYLLFDTLASMIGSQMKVQKWAGLKLLVEVQQQPAVKNCLCTWLQTAICRAQASHRIMVAETFEKIHPFAYQQPNFLPLLKTLLQDEEQLVRCYAAKVTACYLPFDGVAQLFMQLQTECVWRIKLCLCQGISSMKCQDISSSLTRSIREFLLQCLASQEPEMRCSALACMAQLRQLMSSEEIASLVMPLLNEMSTDSHSFVVTALADQMGILCLSLQSDAHFQALTDLVKNTFNIKNASFLLPSAFKGYSAALGLPIGEFFFDSLKAMLLKESSGTNWRVRLGMVQGLCLSNCNSLLEDPDIKPLVQQLKKDPIHAVRVAARRIQDQSSVSSFSTALSRIDVNSIGRLAQTKSKPSKENITKNYQDQAIPRSGIKIVCPAANSMTPECLRA